MLSYAGESTAAHSDHGEGGYFAAAAEVEEAEGDDADCFVRGGLRAGDESGGVFAGADHEDGRG